MHGTCMEHAWNMLEHAKVARSLLIILANSEKRLYGENMVTFNALFHCSN